MKLRTEVLLRVSLLVTLIIAIGVGTTSFFLGYDMILFVLAATIVILMIISLQLGENLRCRDVCKQCDA
jgi:membrane protein YdbS with pleckstrin-like domain